MLRPHAGHLCSSRNSAPRLNLDSESLTIESFLALHSWWGPWGPRALKTPPQATRKENYDKPRECINKQRHLFADKGPYHQSYGFSSRDVWMWELDHKGGWALKNWCFWVVVPEKTLESPLDCKETKPISPKGNQPWIFIGRTDAETEAPILWPPDVNSLERPWCGERLRAGGEVGNSRCWMASSTQRTWVWASSGR